MKRSSVWMDYTDTQLAELEAFADSYKEFISTNKTERECAATIVETARANGYIELAECVATGQKLAAGDKIYAINRNKTVLLMQLGTAPLAEGLNILGAHIDSPRLDLKQNPLSESDGLAYLDTHYYGGIKKYQWLTIPLALHGIVCKKDATTVNVSIGDDPSDPVFCITDLLPHLAREQMGKKASEIIDGELLDVLVGNRPLRLSGCDSDVSGSTDQEGNSSHSATPTSDSSAAQGSACADESKTEEYVRAHVLNILSEMLGIDEDDLMSAELEIVPAGNARDLGFDRSMILGYGHDDRACAYPSLRAQLACGTVERSAVTLLVDKEEIGSVGATGMTSRFFEDAIAEICSLAGEGGELTLRRCLRRSRVLSSDVSAAFDPAFASVFEKKNAAYLGRGLAFNKYTGSGGKASSNDADAEYVAQIRSIMDEAEVRFQTCELGKVDAGGGGTIAYILARYGMSVIDCGVPVLSMHAPWEVASKADLYEAYRGYRAFLSA